jgi:ubiquinone/menaquinone biosynthesis C-methylase UbiE
MKKCAYERLITRLRTKRGGTPVWVKISTSGLGSLCAERVNGGARMAGQNVYDDPEFFAAYQRMCAAEAGINAAVEEPALRALLPDVTGTRVVDLGCGDGRLCRYLAARGAAHVLGVDPSARMLALARQRTSDRRVHYEQAFAEDCVLPPGTEELVVSSFALHYVADLAPVLYKVSAWLSPGGLFVASMEHPVITAAPEVGRSLGVVDGYFAEGQRVTRWLTNGVIKHHRTVSTIVNAVIAAGLTLERLDEPSPTLEAMRQRPDLDRHARRPALLLVRAVRTSHASSAPIQVRPPSSDRPHHP